MGGALATSVGQAFVAGYRAALQQLFSPRARGLASALCVTEEHGAHPRAISTTLSRVGDQWRLHGRKRWVSGADPSLTLFVVATTGTQPDGRPALRVAAVPANREGVALSMMSEIPFVPDVLHANVSFDDVRVNDQELLDGDGYAQFVKPFRTVEDLHVFGAVLGYLVSTARELRWPSGAIAPLVSSLIAARALSLEDPSAPVTHLALQGVLSQSRAAIEALDPLWQGADDARRTGWQRDRALLGVASKARTERAHAAARALGLAE